jgi:hypothetical protein
MKIREKEMIAEREYHDPDARKPRLGLIVLRHPG